jgi:ferrous iron transport protein A
MDQRSTDPTARQSDPVRCKADLTGHCSLATLGVGCCGKVVGVEGETELRRRLLEMGLCGGTEIECVRKAPLGDPIEFRVRGYLLSLRGEQAKFVQVIRE